MPDAFAAITLCATAVGAEGVSCALLDRSGEMFLEVRGTWEQAQALAFALWQDGRLGAFRVHVVARECGP